MVAFATANELRSYLEIPFGELDNERADLILELVSGPILSYTNRTEIGFEKQEGATFTLDGSGSDVLLLPVFPLLNVVSLTERISGAELVDDVDFEWSAKGILTKLGGRWSARSRAYVAEVDYNYAEVPAAVKAVALRLAARAVTNPEGLATESAGGYVAGFAFDDTRLPTVSAPDRRDLNPFRIES